MNKKILKRVAIITSTTILIIVGSIICSRCVSSSYDNSGELARLILSDKYSGLSEKSISAALNAKYPAGTSSSEILSAFKKQTYARCRCKSGTCGCTIPYKGQFCINSVLIISFQEGEISSPIDVRLWADGC